MTEATTVTVNPVEPTPVATISDAAQQMLNEGIEPAEVDLAALLKQVQEMQARLDQINESQRLVNAGTVETSLNDLTNHVNARANQSPDYDFSALKKLLATAKQILDNGGDLVESDVTLIRLAIEDMAPHQLRLELDYFEQLGRDLLKAVLQK